MRFKERGSRIDPLLISPITQRLSQLGLLICNGEYEKS